MSTGQYENLNQNAQTFRKDIGSYSSATPFFKAIFEACNFERIAAKYAANHRPIMFLDAMSGPGKLGKDISKTYGEQKHPDSPLLQVFFNDKRAVPLAPLGDAGFDVIPCDVRALHKFNLQFDVIAVRYGLKDLPKNQIPLALASLHASLLPGGRLVIADMTAKTHDGQKDVVILHSSKQALAGRDLKTEGVCHIPLREEWIQLLTQAGFSNPAITGEFTSDVETSQWKGQFGSKDTPELSAEARDLQLIERLDKIASYIAHNSAVFTEEFGYKVDDGKTFIKFPIIVATGEKA